MLQANKVLAIALIFFLVGPSSALAQANLNLRSTNRTSTTTTKVLTGRITEGTTQRTVSTNSSLTSSERVALYQVITSGVQRLLLNQQGAAVGGSLNLTAVERYTQSTSVLIPQGVNTIWNAATGGNLTLSGNLTNAGSLLLFLVARLSNQWRFRP